MAEVTTPTAGTAGGGPSPMLKLFLEALGGAGSAMSEGKPIGPALNKTMMGNMGNQGMLGLLKAMLSGDNELAGKFDNKGMQLSVPPSMMSFGSESLGMGNPGSYTPSTFDPTPSSAYGKTNVSPLKPNQPQSEMSPYANPSSSPLDALTAADLVGLTPGDLMKALQFKLMKDELAGKESYQQKQLGISEMNARTAQRSAATSERNSNISMLNAIKSLSRDERTAAIQNFEYAQRNGFTGTFEELQREVRTTHQKDYDRAVKGGYKGDFQTWLREMTALGGGLNLSEKTDVEEMKDKVARQSYVKSPDLETTVRQNLMKDNRSWRATDKVQESILTNYPNYSKLDSKQKMKILSETRVRVQKISVLEQIDAQVRSAYIGQKVVREPDGWYVDGVPTVRNPYYGR